jgi:hypothetical protein
VFVDLFDEPEGGLIREMASSAAAKTVIRACTFRPVDATSRSRNVV